MELLTAAPFCKTGAAVRSIHPSKPMMHIAYSPYFHTKLINPPFSTKFIHFLPIFVQLTFLLNLHFVASPNFDHDAFTHNALHVQTPLAAVVQPGVNK